MVKPLGLDEEGESWKPMIRQRVCNKGGKLGGRARTSCLESSGCPSPSQIGCSLTHTGRASLPWECSDPLQGRWGRSESPSSSCCFCDLLPGRDLWQLSSLGRPCLGSWWFQELKCLSSKRNLMSKWLISECHILILFKLHIFPMNDLTTEYLLSFFSLSCWLFLLGFFLLINLPCLWFLVNEWMEKGGSGEDKTRLCGERNTSTLLARSPQYLSYLSVSLKDDLRRLFLVSYDADSWVKWKK